MCTLLMHVHIVQGNISTFYWLLYSNGMYSYDVKWLPAHFFREKKMHKVDTYSYQRDFFNKIKNI
jgi:hypothetical protein